MQNSVAKVTKPKLITYKNVERKYCLKPMNLDRNTIKLTIECNITETKHNSILNNLRTYFKTFLRKFLVMHCMACMTASVATVYFRIIMNVLLLKTFVQKVNNVERI